MLPEGLGSNWQNNSAVVSWNELEANGISVFVYTPDLSIPNAALKQHSDEKEQLKNRKL